MPNFTAGTSFTDGVTNDVTAAKLNALIADAVPTASLSLNSTTGTISQFSSGTGTAASPAIQPTGDANTGIFFPAADTIALSEGGTESMRIDSSGNVGIGITSKSLDGKLTVLMDGSTNASGITIKAVNNTGAGSQPALCLANGSGDAIAKIVGDNGTGFLAIQTGTSNTERLRIDSSGNVGIGVAPSGSGFSVIEMPNGTVVGNLGNTSQTILTHNAYWNSSTGWIYKNSSAAGYYSGNSGIHTFYTATSGTAGQAATMTERLRIDSSGRVGIGTSSPEADLDILKSSGDVVARFRNGTGTGIVGVRSDNSFTELRAVSNHGLMFSTNNTERLRITSGGQVLIGTTSYNSQIVGVGLGSDGLGYFTRDSDYPLIVNRKTNDGTIVSIQQDGTAEGTISVSGTTVSYNGGHLSRWSQLPTGDRDLSIKKGTVLSNLDEMCVWNDSDGNPLPNEQLNRVKISDVEGDSNVAGVFVNWDNDDQDNPFDLNMAMTGDMIIRIAQGVSVSRGDLLMSAGDGTAKPQGDDIRKAKTIAKVTSTNITCTYEDGSYCVPCVLMAC